MTAPAPKTEKISLRISPGLAQAISARVGKNGTLSTWLLDAIQEKLARENLAELILQEHEKTRNFFSQQLERLVAEGSEK